MHKSKAMNKTLNRQESNKLLLLYKLNISELHYLTSYMILIMNSRLRKEKIGHESLKLFFYREAFENLKVLRKRKNLPKF